MKFLQKILTDLREQQTNERAKKIHLRRQKRKAWNRGKGTHMPVTVTEGLAATDKG